MLFLINERECVMNFLQFINYFYKVKSLFSYLPKGIQEELVDDMAEYYNLCILAKLEKLKGVNNEV